MPESTEQLQLRMALRDAVNSLPDERGQLEQRFGQVWDTQQLQEDFVVHGFLAPLIQVTRKSDNVNGAMMFQHSPRYYFLFTPDKEGE